MVIDYLFYLGRVLYGGFFIMQGINHFMNTNALAGYATSKKVPMPKLAVIFTGLLLFLGGLWILTGAYVEIGVLELALFLIPTSFIMHDFWNDTDPMQKMSNKIQFMKNMALLGAAFMLLQIPANPALFWGWSLF
jgi:putative oxidoreductase